MLNCLFTYDLISYLSGNYELCKLLIILCTEHEFQTKSVQLIQLKCHIKVNIFKYCVCILPAASRWSSFSQKKSKPVNVMLQNSSSSDTGHMLEYQVNTVSHHFCQSCTSHHVMLKTPRSFSVVWVHVCHGRPGGLLQWRNRLSGLL